MDFSGAKGFSLFLSAVIHIKFHLMTPQLLSKGKVSHFKTKYLIHDISRHKIYLTGDSV
jgi:hypothetical protein